KSSNGGAFSPRLTNATASRWRGMALEAPGRGPELAQLSRIADARLLPLPADNRTYRGRCAASQDDSEWTPRALGIRDEEIFGKAMRFAVQRSVTTDRDPLNDVTNVGIPHDARSWRS